MRVLWFRLSRQGTDPCKTAGTFVRGRIFIAIHRGSHWQCAFVIAKGSLDQVQARGIEAFRDEVARLAPVSRDRVEAELTSFDDVKLLTVQVNRVRQWHRPSLLLIGDAAHAMSPVGGVGVNLAVQDAVASANVLAEPLLLGRVGAAELAAVQRRREWPTHLTQRLQVAIQNRVISPVLGGSTEITAPLPLRLLGRFPFLRRIPGRVIGMGLRPEHIRTPEAPRLAAPGRSTTAE